LLVMRSWLGMSRSLEMLERVRVFGVLDILKWVDC
jgi:hypothetical protein